MKQAREGYKARKLYQGSLVFSFRLDCLALRGNFCYNLDMKYPNMKELVDCAMKRAECDLVIRGGRVFNVFTGEVEQGDVAVRCGVIVGIGEGYRARETYDAAGRVILPGFLDSHIHVESSMLTPEAFARLAVAHGTSGIVADPHELVNVCGVQGAEYLAEAFSRLRAGQVTPMDVFMQLPSCVPATPFETSGARLDARATAEELERGLFFGLGEMMNYPAVLAGEEEVLSKLEAAQTFGKIADGHAPGVTGDALNAYLCAQIATDHESLSAAEVAEKIARGMYVQIRCGSSANNAALCAPLMTAENFRRFLLCSDDKHAADLMERGHMDDALRTLAALGVPPLWAVCAATKNVAECYGLRGHGAVAPGYYADMVAVDDVKEYRVRAVWKQGVLVAENGSARFSAQPYLPDAVRGTVHAGDVTAESFRIALKGRRARAMYVRPNELVTEERIVTVESRGGDVILPDGLCKLAVVERHFASGNLGLALVQDYGFRGGALGISVAHDSHNLVVLGDDNAAMARVVALLKRAGGGMALVGEGVEEVFALDVAGLMSSAPAETVARETAKLAALARRMGVKEGYDPFMTLAFLALPVIPHLKLTDRGLFDVDAFRFTSIEADE